VEATKQRRTPPELTFRPASREDYPAIAELGFHSFPSANWSIEQRLKHYEEDPLMKAEEFLVGESGGRVVTSMYRIPYTAWVGGSPQGLIGLAGVVVAHEARRKGCASALVTEGLRIARSEGKTLSALYAFRHDFYASLGYALAVERRVWELNPADLPLYPEREGVRRGTLDDIGALSQCYDRVMKRSTLMFERSELDWRHDILDDGKRFFALYQDGQGAVRGYYLFRYEEFPEGRLTRLVIPEVVFEDEDALRGLLGRVAALRDQFTEVQCKLPADERLELRLRNPRRRGAALGSIAKHFGPEVLYGAMARVIDVEGALRARASYPAEGRMTLEVADPTLPENAGSYDVAFSQGGAEVTRGGTADGPRASMGIGELTQLYLGFASAGEARRLGLIEADDEAVAVLDAAFAGPKPYLLDLF
jgi:predicted acetyltransferase